MKEIKKKMYKLTALWLQCVTANNDIQNKNYKKIYNKI